jgi:hypothetical protein
MTNACRVRRDVLMYGDTLVYPIADCFRQAEKLQHYMTARIVLWIPAHFPIERPTKLMRWLTPPYKYWQQWAPFSDYNKCRSNVWHSCIGVYPERPLNS